ncbi:MAG: hypothetical protein IK045_09520 [Bacteroidales bacterium]|nr:hypothetical protein [Bacteroidales bacterium]
MKRFAYMIMVSALLAACGEKDNGGQAGGGDKELIQISVSRNTGWAKGDRINVNGQISEALPADADGNSVVFGIAPVAAPWHVASPYNAIFSYSEGKAKINLPEQRFPSGAARQIYLGKGEGECALSPMLSTLTLMGGIETFKRIKITALGGKVIAGAFTTDYSSIIPESEGGSDFIEVRGEGGEAISLPLAISLPPDDYSAQGLRLVVTGTDGLTREAVLIPPQAYAAGAAYSIDINSSLPHPEGGKISVSRPDRAWAEGDAVSVNGKRSLSLSAADAGSNSAEFEVEDIEAPFCVAAPASALESYSAERGTVVIPTAQKAGETQPLLIGRADDAAVSLSEVSCTVNLISETITGAVSSIKISAGGSANIAGTFSTNFWTISGGTSQEVKLTAAAGTFTLPASVVIAPADLREDGLTVVVTDSQGDERSFELLPTRRYSAGETYTLSLDGTAAEPDVEAEVVSVTSSTATVAWTLGGTPSDDAAVEWTLSVYDDPDGSPVREYSFPAGASCWGGKSPRYTVAGLAQGSTWFFKVTSEEHESELIDAETLEFTPVMMPETISGTGVVLAEDFSELCWDFDGVGQGAGIAAPSSPATYQALSSTYVPWVSVVGSYTLFTYTNAFKASRLKKWARDVNTDSRLHVHPGYVTIGSGAAERAWLLTPPFPVQSGKTATVKVTLTVNKALNGSSPIYACGFVNNSNNDGAHGGGANMQDENTSDFSWPNDRPSTVYRKITVSQTESWQTFSFEGMKISRDDRMIIGATTTSSSDGTTYKATDGQRCALNLSEVKVEVTSIE